MLNGLFNVRRYAIIAQVHSVCSRQRKRKGQETADILCYVKLSLQPIGIFLLWMYLRLKFNGVTTFFFFQASTTIWPLAVVVWFQGHFCQSNSCFGTISYRVKRWLTYRLMTELLTLTFKMSSEKNQILLIDYNQIHKIETISYYMYIFFIIFLFFVFTCLFNYLKMGVVKRVVGH